MDEKTGNEELKQGLDRLEEMEVADITDADLGSVAGAGGGLEDVEECSVWCCSTSGS